jgi:hypothetical protein
MAPVSKDAVNAPHGKMLVFMGLSLAALVESTQGQNPTIPDYQTREQPDGCLLAPSDYGPPPYSVFRDTEDYTYLRDPKKHDDPFDPIKYIPLTSDGDVYLSFGGEIRERWEYYSQPPFGQGQKDPNGYYLQRYMLHADLHVGETFRLFTQFKSDLENDRTGGPRPSVDEDKANIQQMYLDANFPAFDDGSFTLRLGRQELAYGIGRLIDPREGPNVRQSFDGVKWILHIDQWEVDGFATRLAETNTDRFDNPDPYTKFWGVYATRDLPFLPGGGVDLYYLGSRRNFAPYDSGVGTETRHTLGSRLHGKAGDFDYDVEGGYQFGTFGSGDISAWFIAEEVGWTFTQAYGEPHLAFKVDASSGDNNPNSPNLQTFSVLYPRGNYFTEPTPLGAQNIINVHPEIDWRPTKSLTFTLTPNFYWRESTNDGLYNAGGFPEASGGYGDARYVGEETNLVSQWQINRHLTFTVSYDHFFAGDYAREIPGSTNFNYVATWLTFKF